MRRAVRLTISVLAGLAAVVPAARADMVIHISRPQQQLMVSVDGDERYRWPVSTGVRGLETPTGSYRPLRMHRKWYSRQYDFTPMPWSIFFHKGFAVHATGEVRKLGRPASHGCVRLSDDNAAMLYALVSTRGMANVRIVVSDEALPVWPGAVPMAEAARLLPPARPVTIVAAKGFAPPAAVVAIVVPLPDIVTPRFDDKPAAQAPVAIVVPLPELMTPRFEAAAAAVEPAISADATPVPMPRAAAIAAASAEPVRAHAEKPPFLRSRSVPARATDRFTAVGSDAEVLRGREAWLRSLGRSYAR
jgi:hypothetical protein